MHVCIELASDGFAGNFRSAADAARRLLATARDGNRRREQGKSYARARIVKRGIREAIMMRTLRRNT
jgi:hypothetical protein